MHKNKCHWIISHAPMYEKPLKKNNIFYVPGTSVHNDCIAVFSVLFTFYQGLI